MTHNLIRTLGMSLGILLLTNVFATANTVKNSSDKDNRDSLKKAALRPLVDSKEHRSFPQLDGYVQNAQTALKAFTVPMESSEAMPEFTPEYISQNFAVSAEMADARALAQATFDQIDRSNNYIENLLQKSLVELPVGMKKQLGKTSVAIGVSKAKFFPEYTLLTIFCKIDLPQGKTIFFGADGVKLSKDGGLIGGGNLVLLGDFQIPINGGNSMLTLKGGLDMKTGNISYDKVTYASIECNGIKNLNIAADFSFPRTLLVPLLSDYTVDTDAKNKVQGSFEAKNVTDWNDINAEISLPLFAIKGFERVAYRLDKAVIDLSDKTTPSSVKFPVGYASYPSGQVALWRGVYIEKFSVILPKEFKDKKTAKPITFEANNLIIDNTGITGVISGRNILETGSASGWDFSIEKFEIELQSNSLRRAGFNGSIAIPLSKKKNETDSVKQYGLAYRAVFLHDVLVSGRLGASG